jgi:hypothetical protein
MSFAEVQERLTKNFSGANAAYLETYAGKMGILSNAAGEATEIIGKSLMDSLGKLTGDGNTVQPLADAMLELATYTADVIDGIAILIAEFKKLPGVEKYISDIFPEILKRSYGGQILELLRKLGGDDVVPGVGRATEHMGRPGAVDPNAAARKAAEAAAAKRAKELANMQKKTLDTQKKQNALTKAAKTLDLERIGMTAALRGKISETDRLSLNLQLALLDDNQTKATKLSQELTDAVKRQNDLKAALLTTPEAPNPYRNWTPPAFHVPSGGMGSTVAADYLGIGALGGAGSAGIVNVIVNLDGDVVGGAVTSAQVNQSLSGTFSDVSRYNGRGAPSIK